MWVKISKWTFHILNMSQELPKRISTAEEKEILSLLCRVHELEIDKVNQMLLMFLRDYYLDMLWVDGYIFDHILDDSFPFLYYYSLLCRWRWRARLSWKSMRWGDGISWFSNMTNKDLCAMKSSSANRNWLKVNCSILWSKVVNSIKYLNSYGWK